MQGKKKRVKTFVKSDTDTEPEWPNRQWKLHDLDKNAIKNIHIFTYIKYYMAKIRTQKQILQF